jgi:hypothetical protein
MHRLRGEAGRKDGFPLGARQIDHLPNAPEAAIHPQSALPSDTPDERSMRKGEEMDAQSR